MTLIGSLVREVVLYRWLTEPKTVRRVKQRIGVILDWANAGGVRKKETPNSSLNRALQRIAERMAFKSKKFMSTL